MNEVQNNNRCFFTQQVFLIGTFNEDNTANFAPISWISFAMDIKSCLVISMGYNKQTRCNIDRTGILSATVLTSDLLPFAECHNAYTKNDELLCSVMPKFCSGNVLNVPLIENAKWSYECQVIRTVKLEESITYFAQFEKVNIRDDVASLDFIDLRVIDPIIYSPNNYFTVGKHLGEIGDFSKEKM